MTFLASPFTDEESKAYTGDTTHSLSLPWAVGKASDLQSVAFPSPTS